MSNILGANQSPRIPAGFLNQANDPAPGVPLTSPSGSIVQPYNGQIGAILSLSSADALKLSDTVNIGTLFEGQYQYVKILSSATTAPARGGLVYWNDYDNKIVTTDAAATNQGLLAGVLINAPTKGNWCWIQVAGKATVLFKNPLTKVAASGDLVVQDSTPANTGDVLADATALTSPVVKTTVGVALEAPTNGGLKLVNLWLQRMNAGS